MADVTIPDITTRAELGDLSNQLRFPMADRFMQIQRLNAMHEWATAYRWQNLEIRQAPLDNI